MEKIAILFRHKAIDESRNMKSSPLYQQYFEEIKKYLARFVDESVAEDLAQDTFIKVDNSIEDFRGESSQKTWIYRIATNTAKDFIKSRYWKEKSLISDQDLEKISDADNYHDSPESTHIVDEMNECIKEFIHRLPYEYATVLVLCDLEGHPLKDAAEIVGISANNAKVRLHRARLKLRQEMDRGCRISLDSDNRMVCERKE